MGRLFSKCVSISKITEAQRKEMHELISRYYSNVDYKQFLIDLESKDKAFILYEKTTCQIKGFSTIVDLSKEEEPHAVYFSGDTVVDKDYWGDGALGIAFLKFLFLQKCRRPYRKLYWFLISKGYKTYLLMANNFRTHYPRYETETPPNILNLINNYSTRLYGEKYNSETGIISFSNYETEIKDFLKEEVAPVTEELLKNKRIAFFAKRNSHWQRGDELACLAEMTLLMPLKYQAKLIKKLILKKMGKRKNNEGIYK